MDCRDIALALLFIIAAIVCAAAADIAIRANDQAPVVTHELWDGRLICIQRTPRQEDQ